MYCLIIFATVLMGAFPSYADTEANVCPDDIMRKDTTYIKVYKDKCYKFFIDSGSAKQYWEAQEECEKSKGNLAMPKTKILNQFLVDSLLAYGYQYEVFIGLDDMKKEKTFKWADGSELMVPGFYQNFDEGTGIFRTGASRASKDCITLDPVKNKWRDIDCRRNLVELMFGFKKPRHFICEYEIKQGKLSLFRNIFKENENEKDDSSSTFLEDFTFWSVATYAILEAMQNQQ
ncbi:collectin-10 [Plakobranchus ocellatus]|uniref:Collectin-10 n=1 Tax=Plakobranchus ocellatus TaxID=259542 RepID=A0AAV4ALS5_9GAST|nr:collectin-10 [Plakobranchus ocellatus]